MQDSEAEVTEQKLKIRTHKIQQKANLQKSKNGKQGHLENFVWWCASSYFVAQCDSPRHTESH